MGQKEAIIASKDQDKSVLNDLDIYIVFLLMAAVLLVLTLLIMQVMRKHKEKIRQKLMGIKNNMLWNGIIQSLNISFLQTCITCASQLAMIFRNSQY